MPVNFRDWGTQAWKKLKSPRRSSVRRSPSLQVREENLPDKPKTSVWKIPCKCQGLRKTSLEEAKVFELCLHLCLSYTHGKFHYCILRGCDAVVLFNVVFRLPWSMFCLYQSRILIHNRDLTMETFHSATWALTLTFETLHKTMPQWIKP